MSFNKKSTIILLFVFIMTAALILSGCSNDAPAPTAAPVPTATEPAPVEEPVKEEQPAEEVPAEEPAAEEQPAEEAPAEEPAAEEQPAEEQPAEETPAEEPAAEEQPAEEVSAEEPAAEEQPAEEVPAEEPAAEEQPAEDNFAATVDGEGVLMKDFVQAATFHRYQYLGQYNQYAQMYSMYGLPLDSLNEQIEGILGESGKERIGLEAIDELTYNKVLELEGKEAGIEVSDSEVYAELKNMFGYEEPSAEDEQILGMDSFDVTPKGTDDEDDKNAEFRSYAELVLMTSYGGRVSFDYLKDYAKHSLIDNKLFDEELKNHVFEEEMVNARHILVEEEETANEILKKLEAGEDWAQLASDNSLDTSNKDNSGALGWFGRGMMVSEFEEAAFALEPGEISKPVKTSFGYHIIASDGKEVRPMEGTALESAKQELYREWAISLREKHDILSNKDAWMAFVPMTPAFVPPTTEEPAAEEPAAEEPAAEEPAAEEPAAEEPAAEEPAVEEPAAEEPAAEEPAAEEPAAEVTAAEEPAVEEPAAEEPAAEEPAAEESAAAEPAANADDVVASVEGQEIKADDFVALGTFSRYQVLETYKQYAQYYAMFGISMDDINEYYEEKLGESGRAEMGQSIVDQLAYYKMLDMEAAEKGISVSDQEVVAQMKEIFGYADTETTAQDAFGMDSFNLGEDDSMVEDEAFKADVNMQLGLAFGDNVTYDFYKEYLRHSMLENALIEKELEGRVFEAEMVNARHILVEDESTAREILEKLNNGEEWDVLAAENSIDTSNKDNSGSLGWFGRGTMVSEFEEAAFALEPGEISEPVQTAYGYHIIASDGKEIRPMEGEALQAAQNEVATEWYQALTEKHTVESYEDVWMPLVPMEPAFEPIVIDAADENSIPTFSIGGSDDEETEEETQEAAEETVTEAAEAVEEAAEEVKETAEEAVTEAAETVEEAAEEAKESAEETVTEAAETVEETVEEVKEAAADEQPAEETPAETASEEDEEELTINNTEQVEGAFMLSNDAELDPDKTAETGDGETLTINNDAELSK